jgi:hypothetical protein
VALGVPLVYLGVHYWTPGSTENANGPEIKDYSFYRQPKHDPFTPGERRAVRRSSLASSAPRSRATTSLNPGISPVRG